MSETEVAFVTGASSGIGRATAKAFAEAGYSTAIIDLNEAGGNETEQIIKQAGGEAFFVKCNTADDDSVRNAVEETVKRYGRLDAAFNAAGIDGVTGTMTGDTAVEDWRRVIDVNLNGVWHCMRHQIQQMLKNGGGAIVNCSSTAGLRGAAYFGAYCAAKHGVVGMTKAAGIEYARQGVRINAVCPGMIETPMTSSEDMKEIIEQMAEASPIGRRGQPEEIAGAVLYLCSEGASFVHGQAIAVDAALTSR
ncbi:MAG: SDR family oxidoreductase [Novosphingobium sp.]|nr:SDR family oxidoreductase [Novosphingobium sp.]